MRIIIGILCSLVAIMAALPLSAETWYIRQDGGTRYSPKTRHGQCDGKANAPYSGKGVNQHCAFNDVRMLWDNGTYGNYAWVISGGDTVIIKGCGAARDQQNPDPPHCRIGWDTAKGPGSLNWCAGSKANFECYNPPIPAGTAAHHTRILGACAASRTCNSGDKTIRGNLTQLFGGYGDGVVLNLSDTQFVDVVGLEITAHNGKCVHYGVPAYPKGCSNSPPADDYADQGILTDNRTSNVTLQDVYIHGLTAAGILGPIGGPITMNRVFVGFNGFAGWNFDFNDKPDAADASITASYVTMEGNGCDEEYPVVHPKFPAMICYDSNSGGFGDSWSGQDTKLASFICDHCVTAYNTKDGFIGPHTVIHYLKITNSESYGNMGQQWKWGTGPNSTTIFENNLTVGNCRRMAAPLPGAPPGYNRSLSGFCRAAGDVFAFYGASNSRILFANNTIVGYSATMFDLSCSPAHACGSNHFTFRNNIVLGFLNRKYRPDDPEVPGLFYFSDPSVKIDIDHGIFYNLRSRPCPWIGRPDLICNDPRFVDEPPLTLTSESQLDNFNFRPSRGSPAIGHGVGGNSIATDYFGAKRSNPPSIGAVEP